MTKEVRISIKEVQRVSKACEYCHKKKVKCDGKIPCNGCIVRGIDCVPVARMKKRGPQKRAKTDQATDYVISPTTSPPANTIVLNSPELASQPPDVILTLDTSSMVSPVVLSPSGHVIITSPSPGYSSSPELASPATVPNLAETSPYYVLSSPDDVIGDTSFLDTSLSEFLAAPLPDTIENAFEALANNEFTASTIDDVLASQPISTNSIYRHFQSARQHSQEIEQAYMSQNTSLVQVNTREQTLLNDMELHQYIKEYFAFIDPGSYLLAGEAVMNPKTPSHFLMKYGMCAYVSQVQGNIERKLQLMACARAYAGQAFDCYTVETVMGFMVLGMNFIGHDRTSFAHYTSIASSVLRSIPENAVPPIIRQGVYITSVMSLHDIPLTTRYQTLLKYMSEENTFFTVFKILLEIFYNFIESYNMDTFQMGYDEVMKTLPKILFTKEKMNHLMERIAEAEVLVNSSELTDVLKGTCVRILYNIEMMKVMVRWHGGERKRALADAINIAYMTSFEMMKYGSPHELVFIAWLTIFLHYNAQYELARKMQNVAEKFHAIHVSSQPFVRIPIGEDSGSESVF